MFDEVIWRPSRARSERQRTSKRLSGWTWTENRPQIGYSAFIEGSKSANKTRMATPRKKALKLDEIGYWSEIKLDIIREYAHAYSTILAAQKTPRFQHVYVDAFAGAGTHRSKTTGEEIEGSPVIAAKTQPSFSEYHFIDLDGNKADKLRADFSKRPEIHVHHGDCNRVLLENVFPRVQFKDYRRVCACLILTDST